MRISLTLPAMVLAATASPAAFALSTGNIAFTCFNADRDAVAFVALAPIPAGEVIRFCDSEWNGGVIGSGGAFGSDEGDIAWTAPAGGVAAGTVVVIDNYDTTPVPSVGTVSGGSGLSSSDETIYAYQGSASRQPTVFLASIANHNDGTPDSIANTGLTLGQTALLLPNGTDFAQYTGPRSGQSSLSAYLSLTGDVATNWTSGGEGDFAGTIPSATPFTAGITTVDLSTYVRIGRYDLPEPTRTTPPADNLLCQEASGVAYNWDTDSLFIVGDGGRSVTQVSTSGVLIDTMTLAPGASPQGTEFYDTEGITYIGDGQFVMTEERDRQLVKFTYAAGTTLTRAATQTVKIGTFNDNMGTEGLSYDPLSGGFICLKEITPMGIFQTGVDFAAGTATNGSASTENSIDLFDPALTGLTDVADVFALSNLPSMDGQAQEENLIIVSQEDGKIININRSGVIASSLSMSSDPGNPLSVGGQQHEGITMDRDGVIYVVNENGGGGIAYPQLWVYAPTTAPNTAPTAVAVANAVTSIVENTGTVARIKVADLLVTDDGLGTNTLSLSGTDAGFFEISGTQLFLKAGTVLDFETKNSYSLTIEADDTTLGATPDATTTYTLAVTDVEPEVLPGPPLVISEVAPWSSSNSPTDLRVDWFEVTNVSNGTVDISGWKVDDTPSAFANSATLNGITSIAPGESVIFMETADLPAKSTAFKNLWFGANPPANLQIGSYSGSGIGLSTSGDGLTLYNGAGEIQNSITFGANAGGPPFRSFDNGAGLDGEAVSLLSTTGVFGAFAAANDSAEIGSPGTIGRLIVSEVAAWGSGNSPAAADWFELTNLSARAINLTGWRIDDNTASPLGGATPLNGITSIAPGESVIFVESATPGTTIPTFLNTWFGANPPANLQVGTYTDNGLSTGGDAVHIYDGSNVLRANVFFSASDNAAPLSSFDNAAGINNTFISQLSYPGINGAAVAKNDDGEIGSPGSIVNSGPLNFEFWLAVNGFSSGGFDLDSDNDGLSDGLEYVLNLDPNDASDATDAIELANTGSGLQLGYSRLSGVTDASSPLQISPNLLDWSTAIEGVDYSVQAQTTSGLQADLTLNLLGSGPSAPGTSPDYLTPHVTPAAGASLGGVRIVNHGLVGTGRLSGENLDQFGETQGASSGLFVSEWAYNAGQFSGVFNVLPDRGFNVGDLFSNYAARLHRVEFTFTPYYGSSPVPQGQIAPTYVSSKKFTYQDGATPKFTTGFNPTGVSTLFGQQVGTVTTANGPGGAQTPLLSLDAEAVYLFPDGSGYVSDEYGTYIARFNPAKEITGITLLPAAAQPNNPTGVLNFDSVATPASGRRNNQGLEGMSVTPDGNKLFALMQSALIQDNVNAQQQTRNNTRLFVYDIAGANRENPVLIAEYVVKLPRFDANGDGSGLDRTAAQSEIVAVGNAAFLMLPRDGNGLGTGTATPTVLKSVRLVDFASATNILGTFDGGGVAISPGGVLDPSIVPAASAEVINMLAPADLAKFGFNTNNAAANSNTINEKWEGMSLVPDLSTPEANDFFLFVANDNDFQSSDVRMLDGNGVVVSQGDRRLNAGITNDAMYFAYRITLDAGSRFYRLSVTEN